MKNYHYLLVLFGLLLATSCKEEAAATDEDNSNTSVEQADSVEAVNYPSDERFNDLALFLAAQPGNASSALKSFESDPVWLNYKQSIDQIWQKTNAKLPAMKDWTATELTAINEKGGTLFYPFSGPDFLHADIFFPAYDSIVMIGLEPIGSYPDMASKMTDTLGEQYLNGVHKSLHALLSLSFFRTVAMAKDFNGEVDGTLPVLMHFMVHTGHNVLFQEKVAVLPNGSLTTDLSQANDSTYYGNRYYFQRNGEERVRVLTYFAVNLQNSPYVSRGGLIAKGLSTRTDFVSYLEQLNIASTYLKSASYLMHRPTFSIVRDVILSESENVLQDDSGIPVSFFVDDKWDLTFYGTYKKPIRLFSERQQDDLKVIYEENTYPVEPLPFGIGYQYHKGTSNLMLARKK